MTICNVLFSMFYWIVYEASAHQVGQLRLSPFHSFPHGERGWRVNLSAALTTPLDVTKMHMQVEIGESAQDPLWGGLVLNVMRHVVRDYKMLGLALCRNCASLC